MYTLALDDIQSIYSAQYSSEQNNVLFTCYVHCTKLLLKWHCVVPIVGSQDYTCTHIQYEVTLLTYIPGYLLYTLVYKSFLSDEKVLIITLCFLESLIWYVCLTLP